MPRTVSPTDSQILEELSDRGRTFLDLNLDRDWLSTLTPDPRRQVAGMKKRGTLFPVGAGRYVALPPGEPSDPGELYVAVFGPPPRLKTLAGHSVHMTRLKSARKHFGQERVRAVGRTFYLRSDLERTLLG